MMLPTSYTEKKPKREELTLENMMRIQPNPIRKERPAGHCPRQRDRVEGQE